MPVQQLKPQRVLVVEDDEPSAILAVEAISLLGCEVTRAFAGDEAVELILGSRFDLVFMDYHLPRMNGLDATAAVRSHEARESVRRTPIVGLTASAMPEERSACLQFGMDDVLLKPFRLEELGCMLKRWAEPPSIAA
jgi:CheY-like chemotaxis protein